MSVKIRLVVAWIAMIAIVTTGLDAEAVRRRGRRRRAHRKARSTRVVHLKARVVVLPFSGRGGGPAASGLTRGLRRHVRLVPLARYTAAARRSGVDASSPAGISVACAAVKCNAVVDGIVEPVGRSGARLTVFVRNAKDGAVLGARKLTVKRRQRLKRATTALARRLLPLIRRGHVPEAQRQAAVVEPPPPPPVTELPPPKEESPLVDSAPPPETKPEPRVGTFGRWGAPLVEVSAGIGVSKRNFSLEGLDAADDRSYDGGFYPDFSLHAELYPLVPFTSSFARYIGIALGWQHHLKVSTALDAADRPASCDFDTDVKTTSQAFNADLKLRWPTPWGGAWSPTLTVLAGFGLRDFKLGPNNALPSFAYKMVRLGAGAQLPLGTPLIGLETGFNILPMLSVGQGAVDSLGKRASAFGWSAFAGARGMHSSGAFYFATMEYQHFSSSFDGLNPIEYPLRACTPDRSDATKASDGYLRLWVGGGYAY